MKKQDINSMWRRKGFYASLGIAVIALTAIVGIGYNRFGGDQEEAAPQQQNQTVQEAVVEEKQDVTPSGTVSATPEAMTEQKADSVTEEKKTDTVTTDLAEAKPVAPKEESEEALSVMNTNSKAGNLKFDEEKGLLWPITGNVIMNYSMDSTIYFQTLAQYKCNPALIIAGDVGTDVFCAADGIVTDITNNEETGTTVTTSVGDGYYLVYGQLKDLTVEVGDTIAEGNVIGTIADPTKYYVVEGSNLYFQVLEGEETVNPLLLLR